MVKNLHDEEAPMPPQYEPPVEQSVPADRPSGDKPRDRVNCCTILLAFFLPPLAILLNNGCGASVLINICLLFLGWFPGVIHAYYVLLRE
ncbi:plasma membrane proteolipid 3 [Penicillium longicatenatum]|nr:plasma membrane proteolipid 3 [Penicillium longicatenatum]